HFHSAFRSVHRTGDARQLFTSRVLANVRGTQVVALPGNVNLDGVKKFPAKNLDARDNPASRSERFLHQRRGVNSEIKPTFSDSAPQFFRRIEPLDPRAAAADVWLD